MSNIDINKETGIFQIFCKGIGIYIANFFSLSRVMLFPVFGHVLGIVMIFAPVYYFRRYLDTLPAGELHHNIWGLFLCILLMVVPGFIIFIKAFWEYMVAMVSLNTMVADITQKGYFDDFNSHNKAVKERSKEYIALLLLLTGIWAVLLLIPFVGALSQDGSGSAGGLSAIVFLASGIALFVLSVWFCLSFQVFAFEKLSPIQTLKRSYNLVKNNFWRVVLLGILVNILANGIIPAIAQAVAEIKPIMDMLVIPFESYYAILADNSVILNAPPEIQAKLATVPGNIAIATVGTITTAFVLPFGSACFALLYTDLKKRKDG